MFPTIKELAADLTALKRATDWESCEDPDCADPDCESDPGERWLDVRLQCVDGAWSLHEGDPQYDTDHRGYWGAGSLSPRTNCRELARELIDEAKDHAAQCEV